MSSEQHELYSVEIERDETEDLLRMDPARASLDVNRPANKNTGIGSETVVDTQLKAGDTLEEPIVVTLLNDLKSIGRKLLYTLYPKDSDGLYSWDLWGPLLFSLGIAIILAISAPENQSEAVFTVVFGLIWFGQAVCSINLKLLGATISFFQSVCILGYSTFPLAIAAAVCAFVRTEYVRVPIILLMYGWTMFAAMGVLKRSNIPEKKLLASYPLFLFYFSLSWIIFL
ncbi:rab GTPase binding protein [Schizosaccharomyces japonicus yFS275]|uniref:Protein YIP n=1 Tax=Schizosaccharomyces japonicus (strain yFS275 / FY16936) TaxID=402676 RepID=B6JXU6_SCHJY|nr:rab GTPase binding protein [Schizosaccharomyces japonicus yFS275]EEB06364.1 rab GTPase binding protein [Schizosaccharomyces japonicus yFS275]